MPCNVVFGAGGPTGLECIRRLLEVTDLPVRAVVRKPDAHADKLKAAAGNIQLQLSNAVILAQAAIVAHLHCLYKV